MIIKPFKAIFPNLDLITSTETFFETVKHDFSEYMRSGFFYRKQKKAFYIYDIGTDQGNHSGIIAGVSIEEFIAGNVKKHENTLAHKEQKMTHLLLRSQAMIKPVLLSYQKIDVLDTFIRNTIKTEEPCMTIAFDEINEIHRFWEVSKSKSIENLKQLFKEKLKTIYIADGHHRISTAIKMYQNKQIERKNNEKTIFAAIFSFDQLDILDFNRVIDLSMDIDTTMFVVKISQYCNIEPLKKLSKPKSKYRFHMYLNGHWYKLNWKKSILNKYQNVEVLLDVSLFNKYILKNILEVEDARTDRRIKYVPGTLGYMGIIEKVDNNRNFAGFMFYPLEATEIMEVADSNNTLPPKSSYFQPRIKNGLIVKEL